jgi:hypothetical protein
MDIFFRDGAKRREKAVLAGDDVSKLREVLVSANERGGLPRSDKIVSSNEAG